MLRGSFCCGHGDYGLHPSWTNNTAGVESGPNLSRRFISRNRANPYRSRQRESASQGGPTAVRTRDQGGSKGFSVMEEIPVASKTGNITGCESGQTSLWCFTRESWANRLMRQSR